MGSNFVESCLHFAVPRMFRQPSLRRQLEPLLGLWLCCGTLAGWLALALLRPWGLWAGGAFLLLCLLAARGWGARGAVLAGLVLQQILSWGWGPFPVRPLAQGPCRVVAEHRTGTGRNQGRVLSASDKAWIGTTVRFPGGRPGDTLEGLGLLLSPREATVPGGFDELGWSASAGLDGRLSWRGDSVHVHRGTPAWTEAVSERIRRWVRGTLHARLDSSSAALWTATQLAETGDIPPPALEAFKRSGLFHMLSVSGFHMAVLGGGLVALLSLLRVPRRIAWIAAALLVLGYAWLLGAPPPVARSACAFAVAAVAMVSGWRAHAGNSLCLALGSLVAWDPNTLFQMGALLTFSATAAILWLSPALHAMAIPVRWRENRLDRWLLNPLVLSVAATLATAPILAWFTGTVPWIGIPAGILGGIAFSVGFLASLGVVALGALPAWCSAGFAGASELSSRAVWEISLRSGAWAPGSWVVGRPGVLAVFLWFSALVLVGLTRRRNSAAKAWIGLVLVAAVAAWSHALPERRRMRVLFLDVGQGSAALVRWPSGRTWLVDAGPQARLSPDRNAGREAIYPAMRVLGIRDLDVVAVSHADLDHWGGLPWLAERIRPATLLLSADSGTPPSPPFDSLVGTLRSRGWGVRKASAGQILSYGDGARCEIVSPGIAAPMERNRTSLVLRFSFDTGRVLIAGDADSLAEDFQLRSGEPLRAQVLAAGHHGSKHSSSLAWLRRVAPEDVVLSYGIPNRYKHPNPEVLARLDSVGARTWHTPQGSVEFVMGGGKPRVEPWKTAVFAGPWRRVVSFRPEWTWNRP
jgi:competence protein ComEC